MKTAHWHTIPTGAGVLFFIQIFATLSYAVLYSSLVLYTTQSLGFTSVQATATMGSFAAFNYGLHLLGGYLGGRFISYRTLFCIGMIMQVIGCILLSYDNTLHLYWGLGFFLTGSGLNVTCVNMMLTQLFDAEDKRREGAFLWNYSGMNLGFFIGFSLAGYYQLQHDYHKLFLLTSLGNVITVFIAIANWPKLKDRLTPLVHMAKQERIWRALLGLTIIAALIPSLRWLLAHSTLSNQLVVATGIAMTIVMIFLTLQQKKAAKHKMSAYIIFALASLLFWTLYQLAPMALTLFALHNVDRHVFGYLIAPQWIQNINTIVIVIGGPTLNYLFKRARNRGYHISLPKQFSLSLLFIGSGFLLLPIGIHFADSAGLSNFNWIAASYVLQSIGELLISPIGYAMIGQLGPQRLQGIMMGTWMMFIGVGASLASYVSNWAIKGSTATNPLLTNADYSHAFNTLGISAVAAGIVLAIMIPLLHRLIDEGK